MHHPALGVRTAGNGPATPGLAVVTDGGRIAALGPYETVLGRYGGARVRAWDGVLEPGRYAADGAELLEGRYWPDPREAAELGTAPLPAASVAMTDTRWGASARRGVQRLLARGVTAVAGPFTRPQVAAAVRRAGLRARACALAEGGAADFAVFPAEGADESLATVLAGRLVHRRA
ncbi:hypothetical protein AB0910_17845 [Streptomyces sp. NPDC047002]|uniref:imidazolonepropionase-like domain-containing protein n=1 Tax=Streptomyces sp. NPDC047002 TaxID=3155475 RepID=UPI0034548C26